MSHLFLHLDSVLPVHAFIEGLTDFFYLYKLSVYFKAHSCLSEALLTHEVLFSLFHVFQGISSSE